MKLIHFWDQTFDILHLVCIPVWPLCTQSPESGGVRTGRWPAVEMAPEASLIHLHLGNSEVLKDVTASLMARSEGISTKSSVIHICSKVAFQRLLHASPQSAAGPHAVPCMYPEGLTHFSAASWDSGSGSCPEPCAKISSPAPMSSQQPCRWALKKRHGSERCQN